MNFPCSNNTINFQFLTIPNAELWELMNKWNHDCLKCPITHLSHFPFRQYTASSLFLYLTQEESPSIERFVFVHMHLQLTSRKQELLSGWPKRPWTRHTSVSEHSTLYNSPVAKYTLDSFCLGRWFGLQKGANGTCAWDRTDQVFIHYQGSDQSDHPPRYGWQQFVLVQSEPFITRSCL